MVFNIVPILVGVAATPNVVLCVSNDSAPNDIMGSSSPVVLDDSVVSSVSSYVLNPIDDADDDDDSDEEIQLKPLPLKAVETLRVSVDDIGGEGESSTLLNFCCC